MGAEAATATGTAAWWREHSARLERRRTRDGGLTIERIVAAAVKLVDRDGLDALTVRQLAAVLDTGSASLYRHVAGRDELLVLAVDHVIGDVTLPPTSLDPRKRVERLATGLRRVLAKHRSLLPALPAAPPLGPHARAGVACGVTALTDAGLAPAEAVTACLALINYVLGTVYFSGTDEVFRLGLTSMLDGLGVH